MSVKCKQSFYSTKTTLDKLLLTYPVPHEVTRFPQRDLPMASTLFNNMAATSLEMAELSFLVESLATGCSSLTVSFWSTMSTGAGEAAAVEGGEGDREGTGEGGEGDRLGSLIVFDLFLVRIGTDSTGAVTTGSANGSWITEPCDGKATVDGEENDAFVGDVKGDGGEGEREVGRE